MPVDWECQQIVGKAQKWVLVKGDSHYTPALESLVEAAVERLSY